MKLIDKIKKAIIDDEDDELEGEQLVKKIDVERTTNTSLNDVVEEKTVTTFEEFVPKVDTKKPIIFDEEDFVSSDVIYEEPVKKKEESKVLYGGYGLRDEKTKEKFKPSPVISPVYGLLHKEDLERQEVPSKSLESLFKEERQEINFDTIRQKAYGIKEEVKVDEEPVNEDTSTDLFFEMKDDVVGVDKVTIGDAEEYYQDLGLEYNIDYKDADKEKEKNKMTRSKKNKELTEMVDEEIKEDKLIEEETKGKNSENKIDDEAEEKNLYDLIDMMYDSKE
jgi:hypothetical protein